jgi:hypothetical protein
MRFDPNQRGQELDASLGLIYRLNLLWQRVDIPAASGQYDRWNFLLDRIFCNLMYKNAFDISYDTLGKVTNVKFNKEDEEVYQHLNKKAIEATTQMNKAKSLNEKHLAKINLYNALMLKDIGLRKFMFKLRLYLRQSDNNPSRAMWGAASG